MENLNSMMQRNVLIDAKIDGIVGNGSELWKNSILQKEVQHVNKYPLVFTIGTCDGTKGAALAFSIQV